MFIVTRNDDINFMTRCCGKDHISIHMNLYDSSRYHDNQQRLDLLVCSESVNWLHMFKYTFEEYLLSNPHDLSVQEFTQSMLSLKVNLNMCNQYTDSLHTKRSNLC